MPVLQLMLANAAAPSPPAQGGPLDWINYKTQISLMTGLPDDVLHIFAGLAIVTVAALVMRRTPWHWLPWLAAAAIEFANEAYDVLQTAYSTDEGNIASAWHDFWMTMLWPTIILLTYGWLARRSRRSVDQPPGEIADGGPDVGAR